MQQKYLNVLIVPIRQDSYAVVVTPIESRIRATQKVEYGQTGEE